MSVQSLPKGIYVEQVEQHLLPIYFVLKKGSQFEYMLFSGFVIEVDSLLFHVTAGHCLKKIEEFVEAGWEVKQTRLLDNFKKDANHKNAVPFQYEPSECFYLFRDDGAPDYGLLSLEEYRGPLEANGVVGLDESTWLQQPDEPEMFVLVGILDEATTVGKEKITITHGVATVEPVETPEGEFSEPEFPRFYAKLPKNDYGFLPLGMSGGPVFVLRLVDGEIKYWLHAIQSSYFRATREISACFATPFLIELKKVVQSLLEDR